MATKGKLPPPRLGGDVARVLGYGVEDAVALASGGIEIVRFQGEAMANFDALGIFQGDVAPPGTVVVLEMMIGVQCATGDELQMYSGHGSYDKLVF
jgi:hypothetical protein